MSKNGKSVESIPASVPVEVPAEPPKPKFRTIKTVEYLRYDFTPEEFLEHCRKLSRVNQELARFEEEKKRITASLASDQKDKQASVSAQSSLVSNGYEYRNVNCEIRFHDPEKGKKTLVRLDTGEVVKTSFMDGAEMQEPLFETPKAEEDNPTCTLSDADGKELWTGTAAELKNAADRMKTAL